MALVVQRILRPFPSDRHASSGFLCALSDPFCAISPMAAVVSHGNGREASLTCVILAGFRGILSNPPHLQVAPRVSRTIDAIESHQREKALSPMHPATAS